MSSDIKEAFKAETASPKKQPKNKSKHRPKRKRRPKPVFVRVTEEERAELERNAGDLDLLR